jgi:restriction endonuclease S subunit
VSVAAAPFVALGDCCRVVNGTTPRAGVPSYWAGDIVWVTPTDLGQLGGTVIHESARTISKDALDSHNLTLCPAGSVVLSSRAPIGHLGIAGVPLCTNQGCKTLVPNDGIKSEFLFYSLLRLVPELKAMGSGATFAEISKSQVESFKIPVPTLLEQERIATEVKRALAAVDAARRATEDRLAATESLSAAYLREVFDGPDASEWKVVSAGDIAQISGGVQKSPGRAPRNHHCPYLIGLANLILHGIDRPNIWHGNALTGDEVYGGLFEGCVLWTRPVSRRLATTRFLTILSGSWSSRRASRMLILIYSE